MCVCFIYLYLYHAYLFIFKIESESFNQTARHEANKNTKYEANINGISDSPLISSFFVTSFDRSDATPDAVV